MSQLYLYSNIWIYIWSIFSQVWPYFTYLIHNEAYSVCGNYLPCDTQPCNTVSTRGALKRGIIQTVRSAYQNTAGRTDTPFHLDYQWNSSWLAPGSLVGKQSIGRPSHRGTWLAELRQRRRREAIWLVGSDLTVVCLAVSKFWKVVSSLILKHRKIKGRDNIFLSLNFNWTNKNSFIKA